MDFKGLSFGTNGYQNLFGSSSVISALLYTISVVQLSHLSSFVIIIFFDECQLVIVKCLPHNRHKYNQVHYKLNLNIYSVIFACIFESQMTDQG